MHQMSSDSNVFEENLFTDLGITEPDVGFMRGLKCLLYIIYT